MAPARNWQITIFENPEEVHKNLNTVGLPTFITFFLGQLEACPDTKRIHLQGYLEMKHAKEMSALIKCLAEIGINKPHVEVAIGTSCQNREYCSKQDSAVEGTYFELGKPKRQGKRTDLDRVVKEIEDGASFAEICERCPHAAIKYGRGIKDMLCQKRDAFINMSLEVHWRWGPPGTGKTRFAYDTHGILSVGKVCDLPWCDGYRGEKVLLFDDVDKSILSNRKFLQYLDIYPIELPIKGGFIKRQCDVIYITSNWDPKDAPAELLRRLTSVSYIGPTEVDYTEVGGNTGSHFYGCEWKGITYKEYEQWTGEPA